MRGKPNTIVLEEAMEDLVKLEPTTIIIKEEDNKPLVEETTSEPRGAIEEEVSKFIQMMMVVGIVENQATHRLNAIRSKMMKKEGRDNKITMHQPVKIVIKMVHLWYNMKQQQWLNVHKDVMKNLHGM